MGQVPGRVTRPPRSSGHTRAVPVDCLGSRAYCGHQGGASGGGGLGREGEGGKTQIPGLRLLGGNVWAVWGGQGG